VDRPSEIEELERVLIPELEQNKRQKIHVLCGLGGMGKTQLAVEFARRHHPRFSSVFWLDGQSKDTLKRSIATCAIRIPPGQIPERSRSHTVESDSDVDTVVRDVMGWLARPDNTNWLLVFDHVDREYSLDGSDVDSYDVGEYFSGADHGSILITTRLARLEQLGNSHHLGKVSMTQGQAIFESWYKRSCGESMFQHMLAPKSKYQTNGSYIDESERNHLLQLLDGLPLAIAQAGAYIQESGSDLTKYLSFYRQQWSELMESDQLNNGPLKDYSNRSVWTTWGISYKMIREKHEDTANLLLLWSFLDNKDLWHDLFALSYKRRPIIAQMLSRWIGEIAKSETRFTAAMRLLRSYSLVEEITGTTSYATHPVVHHWARLSQGRCFETELAQLAVVVVGHSVPNEHNSNYYALQRRRLPHAQECLRHIKEIKAFARLGVDQADKDIVQSEEENAFLLALVSLDDLLDHYGKFVEAKEMRAHVTKRLQKRS
jgi:hypothetical protein